jgi:hypothetical protein
MGIEPIKPGFKGVQRGYLPLSAIISIPVAPPKLPRKLPKR